SLLPDGEGLKSMSPEEVFEQWREDLGTRSGSPGQWSRLTEALGRLVLHNSHGVHGRVLLARLTDLDSIVSDLRDALCGDHPVGPHRGDEAQREPRPRSKLLWAHLKPEIALAQGGNPDHFRPVDRSLLEQTIERYMRSAWLANDVLEWMMTDASVY